MENLEFVVGELSASVKTLTTEVRSLRFEVSEIKLFKAKLLGASMAVAGIVSFAFNIVVKVWAK